MTNDEMRQLIADAPTKSESIRRLFRAGISKADIGRFMKLRYQHVYNVLLGETPPDQGGVAASSELAFAALQVDAKGRVQLPADFLSANGLDKGGTLFCRHDARGLTLMGRESALEGLREAARKRMPDQAALLDALLKVTDSNGKTEPGKDKP